MALSKKITLFSSTIVFFIVLRIFGKSLKEFNIKKSLIFFGTY